MRGRDDGERLGGGGGVARDVQRASSAPQVCASTTIPRSPAARPSSPSAGRISPQVRYTSGPSPKKSEARTKAARTRTTGCPQRAARPAQTPPNHRPRRERDVGARRSLPTMAPSSAINARRGSRDRPDTDSGIPRTPASAELASATTPVRFGYAAERPCRPLGDRPAVFKPERTRARRTGPSDNTFRPPATASGDEGGFVLRSPQAATFGVSSSGHRKRRPSDDVTRG